MQGLQKSCFSWVNEIVESSKVYFISINTGVRNRPYEVFQVGLKSCTILKISLLWPIFKSWAIHVRAELLLDLCGNLSGSAVHQLLPREIHIDCTYSLHCLSSPLSFTISLPSLLCGRCPICCASLPLKPPPSYSISLKNKTKHYCNSF